MVVVQRCACTEASKVMCCVIFADWAKTKFSRVKVSQMASLLISYPDFQKFHGLNYCGCGSIGKNCENFATKKITCFTVFSVSVLLADLCDQLYLDDTIPTDMEQATGLEKEEVDKLMAGKLVGVPLFDLLQ